MEASERLPVPQKLHVRAEGLRHRVEPPPWVFAGRNGGNETRNELEETWRSWYVVVLNGFCRLLFGNATRA